MQQNRKQQNTSTWALYTTSITSSNLLSAGIVLLLLPLQLLLRWSYCLSQLTAATTRQRYVSLDLNYQRCGVANKRATASTYLATPQVIPWVGKPEHTNAHTHKHTLECLYVWMAWARVCLLAWLTSLFAYMLGCCSCGRKIRTLLPLSDLRLNQSTLIRWSQRFVFAFTRSTSKFERN